MRVCRRPGALTIPLIVEDPTASISTYVLKGSTWHPPSSMSAVTGDVVPVGGIVLWLELPPGTDSGRLFEEALTQGIRIAPGTIFSNSQRFASFIRLSCPQPFDQTLDDAMQRLGRLASEFG
jgi:hypothetical protein